MSSFPPEDDKTELTLKYVDSGEMKPFYQTCLEWLEKLSTLFDFDSRQTNKGELTAFAVYAVSFPTSFLALVDTYDVLK